MVCLMLSGCSAKKILPTPIEQTETDRILAKKAAQAWKNQNMSEVEQLYGTIAKEEQFKQTDRLQAYDRLITAAIANRHPTVATAALNQWLKLDPSANQKTSWQNAWGATLMQLGGRKAISSAASVWGDEKSPILLRGMAGGILMTLTTNVEKMAKELTALYNRADLKTKMALEKRFYTLLNSAKDDNVQHLASMMGDTARDKIFPWSVILLADFSREKLRNGSRLVDLQNRVNVPNLFADQNLPALAMKGYQTVSGVPFNSTCVTLALPLSGPYSPFGEKVKAGALAAKNVLANNGYTINLNLVDTDSEDWIERLQALPQECVVVGGPLRTQSYAEAKSHGITSSHAVFTFLPNLSGEDEGKKSWRFFSSPNDQIIALLNFTRRLGINTYGALVPEDTYGKRTNQIFVDETKSRSNTVKTISYKTQPEKPTEYWAWLMSQFLKTGNFQAVFWPDTWQQVEKMAPYFFNQGEDRLVLMGTSLWELGLANKRQGNVEHSDLMIFPGIWNPHQGTASANALISSIGQDKVDAWNALGFDFVRFASVLNLTHGWTADAVNQKIHDAQRIDWTMAPIYWTQGKAFQQLFIFRPAATGLELVDEQQFKTRLEEIRARHSIKK